MTVALGSGTCWAWSPPRVGCPGVSHGDTAAARVCDISTRAHATSRRHELLAWAVPRMRQAARARRRPRPSAPGSRRWHADPRPRAARPTLVRGFDRRFVVDHRGGHRRGRRLPVVRRHAARHATRDARSVYLHGGGYVSGIDPFHVRYAARLAVGARRPGRAARLPARARAHLARLPRRRSPTSRARWATDSDERGPGRRLRGRRLRARRWRSRLRDRGGPQADASWCCTRRGST